MDGGLPLEDGRWVGIMALCAALEARFPGVTAEAHDIVVERRNMAEVIRLHGPRVQPAIQAAFEEAERNMGVIAVVAPRTRIKRRKGRA